MVDPYREIRWPLSPKFLEPALKIEFFNRIGTLATFKLLGYVTGFSDQFGNFYGRCQV